MLRINVNIDSDTHLSGEIDSIAQLPILFSGLRARMEKLQRGFVLIEYIRDSEIFQLESNSIEDSLSLIAKRLVYSKFPITYSFSRTCPDIDDYDY